MDSFIENLKRREIPSLYGLRGFAALTVVLFHSLTALNLLSWRRWFPGDGAVALFFELSGLLITWLLLRERHKTGSVNLKRFYARRTLRLFPAFYALWLVCLFIPHVTSRWWAFFYMRDIQSMFPTSFVAGAPIFGVAWSLGVEEKFYLIWPWIVRKLHGRSLPAILVGIGVIDQIYRLVIGLSGHVSWSGYGFETHVDGLLFGAALAIAAYNGWRPPRWMLNPLVAIASLAGVIVLPVLTDWPGTVIWGTSLCAPLFLLLLVYVIAKPPTFLNNKVARFFGNISYSLYLCHMLVIYSLTGIRFPHMRDQLAATVLLSIAAATLSYYCVERPFLKLKARSRRESVGEREVVVGGAVAVR